MRDIFEIIEISKDAEKLLLENKIGKIHSIYRNTINISLGKRIVSIHPKGTIKSPMSLRMKSGDIDLESLDINVGDSIEISKELLKTGDYSFGLKNARTWNPLLSTIGVDFKNKGDKEYLLIKDILKTNIGENDLKTIVLSLIEDRRIEIGEKDYFSVKAYEALNGFISGAEDFDAKLCVENLFKILGLGIGLTPSGDDFIMGLMSVLLVSKESKLFIEELLISIKERLKDSLDKTTFLSSELYFYILEDKYSSIFKDIFKAIKLENQEELSQSILTLLDMGHSSGGDTLCGIVFAIDIIKNISRSSH